MNKKLCEKLKIPILIEYRDSDKPVHTHRVIKSDGKYIVSNIESPELNETFDTVDKLYEELLIDSVARFSADFFDDLTNENIFKNFPKKGKEF